MGQLWRKLPRKEEALHFCVAVADMYGRLAVHRGLSLEGEDV